MILRPFFQFYGAKWRLIKYYPAPKGNLIIEPFAGSATYSLHYPEKNVILIDRDDHITEIWKYLIYSSPDEIRRLPLLNIDQSVDDFNIAQEEKWLIGFWLNLAGSHPIKQATGWAKRCDRSDNNWSEKVRERIASQVNYIKHWTVKNENYYDLPNFKATWFIDPPYIEKGKYYRFGSRKLNYKQIADWVRDRDGLAIVCENEGADWLPFSPFRNFTGRLYKNTKEAVWINDSY